MKVKLRVFSLSSCIPSNLEVLYSLLEMKVNDTVSPKKGKLGAGEKECKNQRDKTPAASKAF